MTSRWIRLDVEWDESGWIDALDGQAAGCWPRLLCWVKLRGKKGQCKIPDRGTLARRWRVTRQAVVELMDAALQNGALRIDGELLIVVNWEEYQEPDSTASERKARQRERERQQKEGHGNVTDVTRDTPVTGRDPPVTGRDRGVTRHVTPDRDKKEKPPPIGGQKEKGRYPMVGNRTPPIRRSLKPWAGIISQWRPRGSATMRCRTAGCRSTGTRRSAIGCVANTGVRPPMARPGEFGHPGFT